MVFVVCSVYLGLFFLCGWWVFGVVVVFVVCGLFWVCLVFYLLILEGFFYLFLFLFFSGFFCVVFWVPCFSGLFVFSGGLWFFSVVAFLYCVPSPLVLSLSCLLVWLPILGSCDVFLGCSVRACAGSIHVGSVSEWFLELVNCRSCVV